MERKRRVGWWVAAIVFLLVLSSSAVLFTKGSGPYAFLYKFPHKTVHVDMSKLIAASRTPPPPGTKIPNIMLLKFEEKDGPAVLKAMKANLSAKDFMITEAAPSQLTGKSSMYTFMRTGSTTEGTVYTEGFIASVMEDMYTHPGKSATPSSLMSAQKSSSCIVLVAHEESWLESRVREMREFLHL